MEYISIEASAAGPTTVLITNILQLDGNSRETIVLCERQLNSRIQLNTELSILSYLIYEDEGQMPNDSAAPTTASSEPSNKEPDSAQPINRRRLGREKGQKYLSPRKT